MCNYKSLNIKTLMTVHIYYNCTYCVEKLHSSGISILIQFLANNKDRKTEIF